LNGEAAVLFRNPPPHARLLRRSEAGYDRPMTTPDPLTPVFLEAIVKQQAVAATYNRTEVILAPHILYTRHGDLHVDAVTIERDGKPPKEVKLGTYKLAGLSAVRITPRRFTPSALFDRTAERYQGEAVMAVDRA
jgi:hypothetical protein